MGGLAPIKILEDLEDTVQSVQTDFTDSGNRVFVCILNQPLQLEKTKMGKAGKSGKKGNSKAAEKKKERLEMEKLMNYRVKLVKAANDVEDPLENLPSFKKYEKGGMNVMISAERVTDLDQTTKDWLLDLITRNMKALYEESDWGWKTENKKEEMFDNRAWYLLARDMDNEGKLLGFAHFRFDMDYDDEVLYVYEIQLEDCVKRKGLGKFMMQVLEIMAFKADMRKIMLTCFKHNPAAQKFFKGALKYEIDETCPTDDVYEQHDYEIVSKFNKRKLAKERAEEMELNKMMPNRPQTMSTSSCCNGVHAH